VFLKGYQWPFDIRKVRLDDDNRGSSIIDILVHLETAKGRRVFLDFRKNPIEQKDIDFSCLSDEARFYLEAANACFGTPYDRLVNMNSPATDFYKSRGVDLSSEPLEIALCAQHNNGGMAVDHWWQSNIRGLFPVGEAAATHGVYRPGGSALNAGQVGSFRASLFISMELRNNPENAYNHRAAEDSLNTESPDAACTIEQSEDIIGLASSLLNNEDRVNSRTSKKEKVISLLAHIQKQMSLAGGPFRDTQKIEEILKEVLDLLEHFSDKVSLSDMAELPLIFRLRDTLICQKLYLSAMADFAAKSGRSRGSALYRNNSISPVPGLPQELSFLVTNESLNHRIQEIRLENGKPIVSWRDVRPIPATDESFELVWSAFRNQHHIFS
jgi:succinate dehydrogenase/fumarate reductase flavoprotein subunit